MRRGVRIEALAFVVEFFEGEGVFDCFLLAWGVTIDTICWLILVFSSSRFFLSSETRECEIVTGVCSECAAIPGFIGVWSVENGGKDSVAAGSREASVFAITGVARAFIDSDLTISGCVLFSEDCFALGCLSRSVFTVIAIVLNFVFGMAGRFAMFLESTVREGIEYNPDSLEEFRRAE